MKSALRGAQCHRSRCAEWRLDDEAAYLFATLQRAHLQRVGLPGHSQQDDHGCGWRREDDAGDVTFECGYC